MRKFCLVPALFVSCQLIADVAVVVHPTNTTAMETSEIAKLYLGRSKSFADGTAAIPLALSESSAATPIFNEKILNKTGSQMKAYWSKLVFTGKGSPPKEVESDAEMIALISQNPSLIGYVDKAAVNDSVTSFVFREAL